MHALHTTIKEILEKTPGLTQKGLALRMGLNPAAINRMLYGRRKITAEEIPVIEKYLGAALYPSAPTQAPQTHDASIPVYNPPLDQKNVIDWVAPAPAQQGIDDAFALYISSDNMAPRYFKGELIYIHPHRPPMPNNDCVIVFTNGDIKIVRLLSQTDTAISTATFNPSAEINIAIKDIQKIYTIVGRG